MNKQSGGFTMVELIVTTVIIGLIVLAVYSLFITINGTQRSSRLLDLATRTAEQRVEAFRNNNYTLLVNGETVDFSDELPADLPSPRSGSATINEPIPGVKRVDVSINYRDGSREKTVRISSLIGQIGIGGQ